MVSIPLCWKKSSSKGNKANIMSIDRLILFTRPSLHAQACGQTYCAVKTPSLRSCLLIGRLKSGPSIPIKASTPCSSNDLIIRFCNRLNLGSQGPQDPVHLARTLRRIKRRLLLEQCGVALPESLQSVPTTPPRASVALSRPRSGIQYALQSKPQSLIRSDSGDSAECTMKVGTTKNPKSSAMGQPIRDLSAVNPASPSME